MSKSREGYYDYLSAINAYIANLTANVTIKSYSVLPPIEKEGTIIFVESSGQLYVSDGSMWISTAGMSGISSINSQAGPAVTIAGGNGITANTTLNTVTLDLDSVNLATSVTGILPIANGGTNSSTALNNNRIMVSELGQIKESLALTNGQLLIGATGTLPVASTLTAGPGINITNGIGAITVTNTNAVVNTGSIVDSTLRWNGSSWVENTTLRSNTSGATITSTSNQLTLGTGSPTTIINSPNTGTTRTYTIPDTSSVTATSGFVMTDLDQSINNTKIFNNRIGIEVTPLAPLHSRGALGENISAPASISGVLALEPTIISPGSYSVSTVEGPSAPTSPSVGYTFIDDTSLSSGPNINYGSGNYIATGQSINYLVYAYRNVNGTRVANPIGPSFQANPDNSANNFYVDFQVSTPSSNYDGFIALTDRGTGGGYNYGIDNGSNTSFTDDGSSWGTPPTYENSSYPNDGTNYNAYVATYKTLGGSPYRSVYSTNFTNTSVSSQYVYLTSTVGSPLNPGEDGYYIQQHNGSYQDIGTNTTWYDWGQSGISDAIDFASVAFPYVNPAFLNGDQSWGSVSDSSGNQSINGFQYAVQVYSYTDVGGIRFYSNDPPPIYNYGTPGNDPFSLGGNFNPDTGIGVAGYVVMLVDQNNTSTIFAGMDIGNTTSFSNLDTQSPPDVSNKLSSFGGYSFNFNVYGWTTTPGVRYSPTPISGSVGPTNPSSGFVIQHSLGSFSGTAPNTKIIESSYRGTGSIYSGGNTSVFIQTFTGLGDSIVTPTNLGTLSGSGNLNHAYNIWSFKTTTSTWYSPTFSTTNTSEPGGPPQYYYINLSWPAATGVTGYKLQKTGSGAGFTTTSSTSLQDSTAISWAASSTVTPTTGPITSAIFERDVASNTDESVVKFRNSLNNTNVFNSFEYTPSAGTYTTIGRQGIDSADNNFFITSTGGGLKIGTALTSIHTRLLNTSTTFNDQSSSSYLMTVKGSSRPTLLSCNTLQDCVYIGTDFATVSSNFSSACVVSGGNFSGKALTVRGGTFQSNLNTVFAVNFGGVDNAVIRGDGRGTFVGTVMNMPISQSSTNPAVQILYNSAQTAQIRNDGLGNFTGVTLNNNTDLTMGSNSRFIGNFRPNYLSRTSANSPYSISATDYVIDSTSGALTIVLPTAVGITGRIYIIANSTAASAVTINTTSSQIIGNGVATTFNLAAGGQGTFVSLMSTGSRWTIIGG